MTKKQEPVPHRHVDEYSEVMRAEEPCTTVLASFAPKPTTFKFDNQDPSEHIILVLRQHPVTLIGKLLIILVMVFLPGFFGSVGVFDFLPGNFQFAALILWYLMIIGYSLEVFLSWFFSVYIITDERIIDVDFISLIHKDIASAKIDNIEDVKAVTGGLMQSVVNFGTVQIQTAGAKTEIDFNKVPQPSKVTRLLNELILEEEQEKLEGRVN